MTKVIKKRFIAGAVCPACGAEDRVLVEWIRPSASEAVYRQRRCVACGQTEREPEIPTKSLSTLPRIRLGAQSGPAEPAVVRILDPRSQEQSDGSNEP
ncbi:MAG: YheV family putative metal-binding protein [Pseudomonadota bacterium]